jgi:antitoxin ParD1/3/4
MGLETMNVSLPAMLKRFVERRVAEGGYGNTSEYVRELIRRDQERFAMSLEREHDALTIRSKEHLKALLEEGEASGPAAEMTEGDWTRLRDEIGRIGRQRNSAAR